MKIILFIFTLDTTRHILIAVYTCSPNTAMRTYDIQIDFS